MSIGAPRERSAKRNGFDQLTKQFPTEALKEPEATEAQDVARFVIREMGSFFPSLDEMKKEIDTPDTIASITERIKRLRKENQEDMTKLSRYYVQELEDDAMDRYMQTDDIKYFDFEDFTKSPDEWAQHYAALENFFRRNDQIVTSEYNDVVARMQYDHLRELLPLYAQKRELERQEEGIRSRQMAQFPKTIEDWRRLSKQTQLHVAHFLMADEPKRENMRNRSQWAWRQTEPLIQLYKNNEGFQVEIERFALENESKDPRARKAGPVVE